MKFSYSRLTGLLINFVEIIVENIILRPFVEGARGETVDVLRNKCH
jgi:hypothetical protein